MNDLEVGWAAFMGGAKPFTAQATAAWPTVLYQIHSLRFARARKGVEGQWRPIDRCGAELSLEAAKDRVEGGRNPDFGGQGYKWQIKELPACAVEGIEGTIVVTEDRDAPFAKRVPPTSPAPLSAFARLVQDSKGFCYVVRPGLRPPRAAGQALMWYTSDSDGIRLGLRWTVAPNRVSWDGVLALVGRSWG
jgi:hypothetical protein